MAIVRFRPFNQVFDPVRDFGDVRAEVNRLFDGFLGHPAHTSGMERVWIPTVDMYETKEELVVSAELPGLNEKDIQLSITGDVLSIRGERQWSQEVKREDYYRGERWYGKFERILPLPISVQADKVTAAYRDGVLTIKLPKVEEIKPKEIKIDTL